VSIDRIAGIPQSHIRYNAAANSRKREGGESRKKCMDSIRSNPKCFSNGQSATKPRTGEGSETKRSTSLDDEIVQAYVKAYELSRI